MKLITLVCSLGFLCLGSTAHAASFDCSKAKSDMEVAICANPELSKADEAMAKAYSAILSRVSRASQLDLRDSQRSFLTYTNFKCRNPKRLLDASCLISAFDKRRRTLDTSIAVLGGHAFVETGFYRIRPRIIPKGEQSDQTTVEEVTTLIQIATPKSKAEATWNNAARRWLDEGITEARGYPDETNRTFEGEDQDVDVSVNLVSASPDMVVSSVMVWGYIKDATHGQEWSNNATNWSLALGRPVKAGDLFIAEKPWAKTMLPLAQKNVRSLTEPPSQIGTPLHEIDREDRWRFMSDGLHIFYNMYELGGYLSAAETVLPWNDLKPYTRKPLPFKPSELQTVPGGPRY